VVALGLLRSTFFLADAAWVGRLGPAALEGMGASSFASWILHTLSDLVAVGLQALVARAIGAGQPGRARRLASQGMWGALALSALMVLAAGSAPQAYFGLLGFAGQDFGPSLAAGLAYLRTLLLGSPALVLFWVVHALFRGVGDTRTPMYIMAGSLALNIVLDPFLLFGLGPFPAMGVAGAALASVLTQGLGVVVGIVMLDRHGVRPRWTLPQPRMLWDLVRIGAPISLAGLGFCLVYVFLGPIVTTFGSGPMAALAVGHRIESIGYLFSVGVGTAAATLVGQNLGASKPAAAARTAELALRLVAVVLTPLALLYAAAATSLFAFFTDDPVLLAAGVSYLRIVSISVPFTGMEVLYENTFSGAGDTLPPLLITLPLTVLRIPAAWYLSTQTALGLDGVWLAIALSTVLKGIVLHLWWRRGRWQRRLGLEA
jgi:putative MATE family efflux protein